MVLFGGTNGPSRVGDTWERQGAACWTQVHSGGAGAPSARAFPGLVDIAGGNVFLFGGESNSGFENDSWEWDGNAWTQLSVAGPSSRVSPLASDPATDRIVLFGGDVGGTNDETWEYAARSEVLCDAGGPYAAECQGATTEVALDGSGSSHPDGDALNYLWTSDCPGGWFDDETSPTPLLMVNTLADCGVECSVSLTVDDGIGASASCSSTVSIVNDCVRSHGYWKNHAERWPVNMLTLGRVSYDQGELLDILGGPGAAANLRRNTMNGLVPLPRQLIAAKLNLENGAPATGELLEAIEAADDLIGDLVVPPIGNGGLHPSETSPLTEVLDAYNNGEHADGPPSCDKNENNARYRRPTLPHRVRR